MLLLKEGMREAMWRSNASRTASSADDDIGANIVRPAVHLAPGASVETHVSQEIVARFMPVTGREGDVATSGRASASILSCTGGGTRPGRRRAAGVAQLGAQLVDLRRETHVLLGLGIALEPHSTQALVGGSAGLASLFLEVVDLDLERSDLVLELGDLGVQILVLALERLGVVLLLLAGVQSAFACG